MLRLHRVAGRVREGRYGIVLLACVGLAVGCTGGAETCTTCGAEGGGGMAGDAGGSAGAQPGTGGAAGAAGAGGGSPGAAGRGGATVTGGSGGGGASGSAGVSGSGGSSSSAGRGGQSGSGSAGSAGSAGSSGGGGAGNGGSAGAGSGGVSGSAGSAGRGGSGGSAGTMGSAGTIGTGGGSAGSGGGAAGAGGGNGGAAGRGATGGGAAGTGGSGGGSAGAGGSGGAGGGQVVMSIDFIGGRTAMGGSGGLPLIAGPAMAATEVAGAKPVAHWNGAANISGTLPSLVLADGTATAASVTWNSPSMGTNPGEWMMNFADMAGNTRMMNGYLDPVAAAMPAVVTVSGLPASITAGGYDVYVYTLGDIGTSTNTRTYNYAIGAATFTVSQTGPSPTSFTTFTLAPAGGAGNYIVFRNVTGASFTLTATPGTGSQTRAPVNGLQIVAPTGS